MREKISIAAGVISVVAGAGYVSCKFITVVQSTVLTEILKFLKMLFTIL